MKIILVIPTLGAGGAERVMSQLANTFVDYPKTEIHLALLAQQEDFYTIDHRVIIHRLGFENQGKLQKLVSEKDTFFKLRALLKKEAPGAVLSFGTKYNVFTLLASKFLDVNVYVSDRSNPLKKIPRLTDFLRKLTYPSAKGIVAQTHFAKKTLKQQTHHQNIVVIPNPVRKIKPYPNLEKEKTILNVGRLIPQKGQKYLIEAFSKLSAPDWKLVILGDGPLRTELENQIEGLKLNDRVFLMGRVANVDEWLAKSAIFAFSSISEGFPNALVEAMAAGLPCVSFDCNAGPRDIINNGENGFLVETKNVESMTRKLDFLINHSLKQNEIGQKAKKTNFAFDPNLICTKYFNFFKHIQE